MTYPQSYPRIIVAICTYNRNEPLATLLRAIVENAKALGSRARVGVVVVDDSSDGNARATVGGFAGAFELGLQYRASGKQNIAIARNLALATALPLADWIAMTDDDCEPEQKWLATLLNVQQQRAADAVSGRLRRRVPPGSASWLSDEPFLDLGVWEDVEDCAPVTSAATHNSLISAAWLRAHPGIRFDPHFGVTGGEDPVFYRTAHRAGLQIVYAREAVVWENEPPERATLAYQLRTFFWFGNSSFATCVSSGQLPARLLLHGVSLVGKGLAHPLQRLRHSKPPQLRYSLASILRGLGVIAGFTGMRIAHK